MTDLRPVILDLCGGTGAWSQPYAESGQYRVIIVTLPAQDVRAYRVPLIWRAGSVRGVLAAPPCDDFSVSGAQYWPTKDADGRTARSLEIVDACLRVITEAGPAWWVMENPIGRLRALRSVVLGEPVVWPAFDGWSKDGPRRIGPRVVCDPYQFGDPYTKATMLWGRFRRPAYGPIVEPIRANKQGSWLQSLGGKSEKTKRLRAMTPPGFARAFFEANP